MLFPRAQSHDHGGSQPQDLPKSWGSCQNDGPFLGTLNIRSRIRIRTQRGTMILTTIHIRDPARIQGTFLQ